MDRSCDWWTVETFKDLTPLLADPELGPQQALGRRGTERYDQARAYQLDFGL
jgi:hypothetical protein